MFLAHLWATEYAAPPELGLIGHRGSTNMSPLRGWERSHPSFEAEARSAPFRSQLIRTGVKRLPFLFLANASFNSLFAAVNTLPRRVRSRRRQNECLVNVPMIEQRLVRTAVDRLVS